MKQIEIEEKELNKNNSELINRFIDFLLCLDAQESYFILEKMTELDLVSSKSVKYKNTFYFSHYRTKEENQKFTKRYQKPLVFGMPRFKQSEQSFLDNYEELSQNDWELHKHLIEEGHNPSEIAKIIRNDEIEKLQEISSQTNFNIDQTIKPSLYERCSFINEETVTLIDYAAFFSLVQCFKYLLMNGANIENTGKYAVVGGNEEIIHLCEQNHSSFEGAYEAAIMFHRNDIIKYIYENKIGNIKNSYEKIIKLTLNNEFMNFKVFNFLLEQEAINNSTEYIYLHYLLFVLII